MMRGGSYGILFNAAGHVPGPRRDELAKVAQRRLNRVASSCCFASKAKWRISCRPCSRCLDLLLNVLLTACPSMPATRSAHSAKRNLVRIHARGPHACMNIASVAFGVERLYQRCCNCTHPTSTPWTLPRCVPDASTSLYILAIEVVLSHMFSAACDMQFHSSAACRGHCPILL